MSFVRLILVAWLAVANLAAAAAPDFSNPEAVRKWMSHYYLKPEPALVGKAVLAARDDGMLIDDRAPTVFGFLSGVLTAQPQLARPLIAELRSLKGDHQSALLLGIWYSGHPETKALLKELEAAWPQQAEGIGVMLRGKKTRLENIPLEDGRWVIDALWGDFGASGHEQPVGRVASALRWIGPRSSNDQLMIAAIAQKTLTEHAVEHPRVMEICIAMAAKAPPELAGPLKAVISEAQKRKASAPPR